MQQAAQALLGEHDFSSFRAAECQARHPVRTLQEVCISRQGDLVFFDLEANAFLHHMVRNIVGSLLKVGQGLKPIDWIAELLVMRDRTKAAATAPAAGLYLTHIRYPEPYCFPQVEMGQLWR
jgi:tRNA pseudouridine38-40 synthase